jgi:hypothetical protein
MELLLLNELMERDSFDFGLKENWLRLSDVIQISTLELFDTCLNENVLLLLLL